LDGRNSPFSLTGPLQNEKPKTVTRHNNAMEVLFDFISPEFIVGNILKRPSKEHKKIKKNPD
jgi:hypothetical protein